MDCDRALCVTSNSGMGGSKVQKKISNLKRKIRQQASKHAHSCKEKDREIQELNQGKDIMTLYFAMPYDTFTTPMETRDVSTIPTGIKKSQMVSILPTTK